MSTLEEQIAAATIAKIFGSELKRVDENTTQQSSNGPATRLDPLSFITTIQENKQKQQQQQVEEANRLAEQLYPMPAPQPVQPLPLAPTAQPVVGDSSELIDTLKSIDATLNKLVTLVETKWQASS